MKAQRLTRTVYYGTFVHSKSLTELEILKNIAVFVDEHGTIVAVERDLPTNWEFQNALVKVGWAPNGNGASRPPTSNGSTSTGSATFEPVSGGSASPKMELRGGDAQTEAEVNGEEESHQVMLNCHTHVGSETVWDGTVEIRETRGEQFFFPGFIDTHIHASQYPNSGIFGNSTLMDWLEKYTFPTEASLASLPLARRVYNRVIARTLSHGTTTAAYYATIDVASTNLLADLCLMHGQRALVGRCCMDFLSPDYYRDESWEASLAATRETISHIQSIDPSYDLISPIITPRFAPSCTKELLQGLGDLAAETNLPIQTHISENHNEIALVRKLFPDKKHYTDVYNSFGLLTPKTILAHCVHLSDDERQVIKERESKISHCPTSNSSITSGAARVRWLLDGGIDVGLGTDVSGGYSPSILEAARQALLVSRHVAMGLALSDEEECDRVKLSVEEVLYLATRGGAKVVGLEDRIGGFEVGKDWDAQLISLNTVSDEGEIEEERGDEVGPVDIFGWESEEDKVAKWVFNGDDRNTTAVWVKGRLVHERRS